MSRPDPKVIYYLGQHREGGHYLWAPGPRLVRLEEFYWRPFLEQDGRLAPGSRQPYKAQVVRLALYDLNYSALSFWDDSIDKRPGSNCIFFVPGDGWTLRECLGMAKVHYPEIFARFPREIEPAAGVSWGDGEDDLE